MGTWSRGVRFDSDRLRLNMLRPEKFIVKPDRLARPDRLAFVREDYSL